jgi:murein DD-endopeptidase MepM/ murein hydrolase activator NlpD
VLLVRPAFVLGFTLAFVLSASPPLHAGPLEIRHVPEAGFFPYDLDPARGVSAVVAQNLALVWRGAAPLALGSVELALLDESGEPVETRHLGASALARAAKRGAALEGAGLLELYAFHFRPATLLGADVKLAPEPTLAPATALLIGHQVLAFQGVRSGLRVRARGTAAGAAVEAEIVAPFRAAPESEFSFPLAGRWFIGAGASLHHHHRWVVPEEFALDIVRLGEEGRTHRGDGTRRGDYLAYGAPVLAAADGTVRAVADGMAESDAPLKRADEGMPAYAERVQRLQMEMMVRDGPLAAAGNHVVVEHPGGLFSFYAHLQTGSAAARIRVGQAVRRGQVIGAVGFSGNSTEPHLHFHVTDGVDPLLSAGVPVRFDNATLPVEFAPRALQSGDLVEVPAN